MNNEPQDPLWQLLGKAKSPNPSPFFARNVVRKVRALESQPQNKPSITALAAWLRHFWKLVSIGSLTTIAAVMLTIGTLSPHAKFHRALPSSAVASAKPTAENEKPGDYNVITNLDTLVASENSDVWLDSNSY